MALLGPASWLAAALLAASGYTIVLKDGSHHRRQGEVHGSRRARPIITLLNGTQTFVRADQIDVARTEAANRDGYGSGVVIPGSPQDVGTAARPAAEGQDPGRPIRQQAPRPRELPGNRRDKNAGRPAGRRRRPRPAINDLSTLPRKPYAHADIAAELQQFFHGQGIEEVEIYEGTQGDRPLLEITTNSEGSVFKALSTAANALLHIRDAFPGKVAAFEVAADHPRRERAGQFVLTPDMATDLVAKKVDVTSFFVKNVQF